MEDLDLQGTLAYPLEPSPRGAISTSALAATQVTVEQATAIHAAAERQAAMLQLQREREIQTNLNNKHVKGGLDAISTQAHKTMGVQRRGEQAPPCTPRDDLRSNPGGATALTPRARLTPRGRTGSTEETSRVCGPSRSALTLALQEALPSCQPQGGAAAGGARGGVRGGDAQEPHQRGGSVAAPISSARCSAVGITGGAAPDMQARAGDSGGLGGGDAGGEGGYQSRRARRRAAAGRKAAVSGVPLSRLTLSSSTRCESKGPAPDTYSLQPIPYTPPCTLHPEPYTLHSKPYTPHAEP